MRRGHPMFESVRAYGDDRLAESDDAAVTVAGLAAWYVEQLPLTDKGQRAWLSSLASEVDTISALIERLEHGDPSLPALARIRGSCARCRWRATLGWQEIDHVLRRLTTPTPSTARLVLFAASLMGDPGEADRAWERCLEGEALLDQVGDTDRWGSVRGTSPRTMLLLRSGRPTTCSRLRPSPTMRWQTRCPTSIVRTRGCDSGSCAAHSARRRGRRLSRTDSPRPASGRSVFLALTLNNLVEEDLRTGRTAQAAVHQREALAYGAELGMEHLATFGLIIAARMAEAKRSDGVAARLHASPRAGWPRPGFSCFPKTGT